MAFSRYTGPTFGAHGSAGPGVQSEGGMLFRRVGRILARRSSLFFGQPPRHRVGIRPRCFTDMLLPQLQQVTNEGRAGITTSRRNRVRSIVISGSGRHVLQYVGGGGIGETLNVVPHSQQAALSCVVIPSMYRVLKAAGALLVLFSEIQKPGPIRRSEGLAVFSIIEKLGVRRIPI